MTEAVIRATLRLGVQVYLHSERTDRVWEIKPYENDKLRGRPVYDLCAELTGYLSSRQVNWHIQNKPDNFTTTPPCASGSTTTNP